MTRASSLLPLVEGEVARSAGGGVSGEQAPSDPRFRGGHLPLNRGRG